MNQVLETPLRLRVDLAGRGYDILIGAGLIDRAGEFIAPLLSKRRRVVVVSDEQVAAIYLGRLEAALNAAGIDHAAITLPAGEASKSFAELANLCDRLLALEVERRDLIIALGGGVIGDLVGFAAAILRRGVDFIQVPTTLLSQVDSAVGGKTAINSGLGKNLIGAFHQPKLVLADVAALDSLPVRERRAGYAEVVKYGAILDRDFFTWLESHGPALLAGDRADLIHAVRMSCAMKAAIVARDERETGDRALLNFGHSFGHALEAKAGYDGRLLHGEAVAIGMAMAMALSVRLGLCPIADAERLRRHLEDCGLPTHPRDRGVAIDPSEMLALMRQDKKVEDGHLTLILARGIGAALIDRTTAEDAILTALTDYLERS